MPARAWRLVAFGTALGVFVTLGTARAQTVVEGASRKVTVECGKAGVRIAGLSNEVTLTGACDDVTVEGKSNTVHIATLGRLTLAGSGNRVYWRDGIEGRAPRISRAGTDNLVERRGSTTPLEESKEPAGAGRGSGVRIVAEKDKATVSTGAVVVDAEKKAAPRDAPTSAGARRPATALPADVLVFADNREERRVDCRGRSVEVSGNRNRLTLQGQCASVRVSGDRNEIDVDAASIIATPGDENTVRYRDLVDGQPPRVVNAGRENTIRRVSP